MKKYLALFLLIEMSLYPLMSLAEKLSYTSASINYGRFSSKVDGIAESLDGDGFTVDLSYAVRQHVAVIASYNLSIADTRSSGDDVNADIDSTLLGMVIHFPINEYSDLVIGVGFFNGKADVSVNGGAESEVDADGGVVTLGFRTMASKNIEISGALRKNSVEENSSISLDFSAAYYTSETLSLDMGYRLDSKDGSDLLTFGVTRYF